MQRKLVYEPDPRTDSPRFTPNGRETPDSIQRSADEKFEARSSVEQDILHNEREDEKRRIARELHDTMLQTFQGAALYIELARSKMPEDSLIRPLLSRCVQLIRQGVEEGRAVVQGLRLSPTEFMPLDRALGRLCGAFTVSEQARVTVSVRGESRPVEAMAQEQIYLVAREAIINALRHSQATEIRAHIVHTRELMRLVVRDNGRGIAPGALTTSSDKHLGILGMRERARSVGARFAIWSKGGVGTKVQLALPISLVH